MTPDELRATLKRLGLSQSEAARLMRVDPRTMRRWLAGDRDIPGIAIAFLELYERAALPQSPAPGER